MKDNCTDNLLVLLLQYFQLHHWGLYSTSEKNNTETDGHYRTVLLDSMENNLEYNRPASDIHSDINNCLVDFQYHPVKRLITRF
jgi:hypothetical protein